MSASRTQSKLRAAGQAPPGIDGTGLKTEVAEVLDRWPSAGLAVAVVRGGSLEWFLGHGVADVGSKEPITLDTVFRIGSLTKTFTAVAVMQLWEQGLVDLDAPASDYLRSVQLAPAKASFRPATVRHLLTHTAGIGYWRRLSDLLQPGVGSGVRAGRRPGRAAREPPAGTSRCWSPSRARRRSTATTSPRPRRCPAVATAGCA